MRKFEKISKEQYEKDLKGKCEYEDISLPIRSTKHSAGYDFKSPIEFELNPGEIIKVPTGIKAQMEDDEYLMLLVRSSMGFKYNVRLCNQVGIVDSDYYNNPDNEGHMFIKIQNEGKEVLKINKGDIICCIISIRCFSNCYNGTSGIFINFFNIINVIINYQKTVLGEKSDITSKGITDIVNVFKKVKMIFFYIKYNLNSRKE